MKIHLKATLNELKVIVSRSHSGTIKELLAKTCKNCEVVIAAGAGKFDFSTLVQLQLAICRVQSP